MKIRKELAKGSTALLVLSILSVRDMYGYHIIRELELLSEEVFQLNEGTLYPILHALEQEKCLSAYWEEAEDTGRRRKYYHITQKGLKELEKQRQEWKTYAGAVEKVMGGTGFVIA